MESQVLESDYANLKHMCDELEVGILHPHPLIHSLCSLALNAIHTCGADLLSNPTRLLSRKQRTSTATASYDTSSDVLRSHTPWLQCVAPTSIYIIILLCSSYLAN